MCGDKVQRLIMAVLLTLSMYLLSVMSIWGFVLQGFIIVMILVWALTNFCPGLYLMQKIFGKCE